MTNQITIEKTDWAGHDVWIICCNGEQVGIKMYSTEEAARKAASEVR